MLAFSALKQLGLFTELDAQVSFVVSAMKTFLRQNKCPHDDTHFDNKFFEVSDKRPLYSLYEPRY